MEPTTPTTISTNFASPQDEIDYLRSRLKQCQNEFDEFRESSTDLEAELEAQIRQFDIKNQESTNLISRLQDENDQLKYKYAKYYAETQQQLNQNQTQLSEVNAHNDRLTNYIRELEQSNDDLERAKRALAASLEDFEGQLNQQLERNVLLENEVSEKEELEAIIQRLKEDARDLRLELVVKQKSLVNDLMRKVGALESKLETIQY